MRDKTILVTGGTGTFGQAFVRAALALSPRQVRVFSRDELKQSEMVKRFDDRRVEYLCGDVRDFDRLVKATDGVDIVVHAAAMKRIEKCEHDPEEAVKTNVLGSMNVANACLRNNVRDAVAISSDKAVYPVNTYGKTKALMENLWIGANVYRGKNHPTRFSVVRYGNVLGSRGSVLHLFREQARANGMVTVNHPKMTRYFMRIEEAVDLVKAAIAVHQGGEIFVPALKAIPIHRLAAVACPDARIVLTSPSAGEKIHEQLLTEEESDRLSMHRGYYVINPDRPSWPYAFKRGMERPNVLRSNDAEQFSDHEIRQLIQRVA